MSSILKGREGDQMLLQGNEAIARGALEAGVSVVSGYPGTPSSEITENLARAAQKDLATADQPVLRGRAQDR